MLTTIRATARRIGTRLGFLAAPVGSGHVWCLYPPFLTSIAKQGLQGLQALHQADPEPAGVSRFERLDGGIAVIDLVGTMTKYGSSFSQMRFGTVGVRRAVRQAAADDSVKAIVLRIDSPGGTFAGTNDLADDVWAARQQKPVTAYIEDLGASAAYFVASQATRVIANPSAIVGCIGIYGVVLDSSEAADRAGVRVHVIRAGRHKGVGIPGAPIGERQLAELQRTVDDVNEVFVAAVARGRKMSAEQVAELADGRVHIGKNAVKVGLVDAIGTLDQAIESLRTGKSIPATPRQEAVAIAATTEPPSPCQSVADSTAAEPAPAQERDTNKVKTRERLLQIQMDAGATYKRAAAKVREEHPELLNAGEEKKPAVAVAIADVSHSRSSPMTNTQTAAPEQQYTMQDAQSIIRTWNNLVGGLISQGKTTLQADTEARRQRPGLRKELLLVSDLIRAGRLS